MSSTIKTVPTMSLAKSPLTRRLTVPILWTLMMKMLRMRLIFVTSLTKILEKKRKMVSLVVFKNMMKYRNTALTTMMRR